MGFRRFGVWGLGFGGLGVWGFGFGVWGFGFQDAAHDFRWSATKVFERTGFSFLAKLLRVCFWVGGFQGFWLSGSQSCNGFTHGRRPASRSGPGRPGSWLK